MNKEQIASKIKATRLQRGWSQTLLAEASGLSLRTIQRIENGETNPMGDSLNRLARALDLEQDALMSWTLKEDRKALVFLNLSAFTFIPFPVLGVLIPFMIWTSKKGRIQDMENYGKALINFQITWLLVLCLLPILGWLGLQMAWIPNWTLSTVFKLIGVLYLINGIYIAGNTIRISNGMSVLYAPRFRFLRS